MTTAAARHAKKECSVIISNCIMLNLVSYECSELKFRGTLLIFILFSIGRPSSRAGGHPATVYPLRAQVHYRVNITGQTDPMAMLWGRGRGSTEDMQGGKHAHSVARPRQAEHRRAREYSEPEPSH